MTTVATIGKTTKQTFAAGGRVFGTHFYVFTSTDALAVFKSFGGTKGPARTTRGLVTNFGNHGAVAPLRAGIKRDWNVFGRQDFERVVFFAFRQSKVFGVVLQPRATQLFGVGRGVETTAGDGVGDPRRLGGVHVFGDFVVFSGLLHGCDSRDDGGGDL